MFFLDLAVSGSFLHRLAPCLSSVVRECFFEPGVFYVEYVTSMLADTKLRNLKPKEKARNITPNPPLQRRNL
ncbi:hypothetical protein BZK31_11810 [Pseudomonas floridensis]|uniref:Uncharacterized protein n=1 Tax=Pseudomonas floridensis TaxID=1958950 RepID=A0A1X0N6C4_9PSED|nr:hypothetical protein BZK31_11810 [Pseudomonas floridensis]